MRFTDRWQRINKRGSRCWGTIDNDVHNNTGYIYEIDVGFGVSVSRLINGHRVSMATEYIDNPKTLDEAKELAEKFMDILEKVS